MGKTVADWLSRIYWFGSVALLVYSCGPASTNESVTPVLLVLGMFVLRLYVRLRDEDDLRQLNYSARNPDGSRMLSRFERPSWQIAGLAVLAAMTLATYGLRYNLFVDETYMAYDHQEKTMEVLPIVAWRPGSRYTLVELSESPLVKDVPYYSYVEFRRSHEEPVSQKYWLDVRVHFDRDATLAYQRENLTSRLGMLSRPDESSLSFWWLVREADYKVCGEKLLSGLTDLDVVTLDLPALLTERLTQCYRANGFNVGVSKMVVVSVKFEPKQY